MASAFLWTESTSVHATSGRASASTIPGTPPPEPRSRARPGPRPSSSGSALSESSRWRRATSTRLDDARQVGPRIGLEEEGDEGLAGVGEAGRERRPQGGRIGLEQPLELDPSEVSVASGRG